MPLGTVPGRQTSRSVTRRALDQPKIREANKMYLGNSLAQISVGQNVEKAAQQQTARERESRSFPIGSIRENAVPARIAHPVKQSVPAVFLCGNGNKRRCLLVLQFFGMAGSDAAAIAWPWRLSFSSGTTRLILSSGNSALSTSFALSMMMEPPSPEVTRPMMSRFS